MLIEASLLHQHSTADAKIRLFRSLFRGRNDVYPRRFESRKTGRSGYAPACGNEWVRGICEKPRIKCSECQYRQFLPLTDEVIRWHLSGFDHAGGPFAAGIYPMLQDETCFFLAADFDKEGWREDSLAFMETYLALGVPAALEIALPLQKQPRDLGNSVFLDDQMVPYTDQWAFRSSVERIGKAQSKTWCTTPKVEGVSSASDFRQWTKMNLGLGPRRPPDAGKTLRLLGKSRPTWSSC